MVESIGAIVSPRASQDVDRRQLLLYGVEPSRQQGVEIGALDRPIVPREAGNIFYVDFADTETLRRNYAQHPYIKADRIVDVDGIWGAQTLAEVLGPVAPADYIVASHVIEHVPDLIAWLKELKSILKSDGQVNLAIPDRRYTFDYHRAETRLADVLDAHLSGARAPLPREVIDYVLNATEFDPVEGWEGRPPADARPWVAQAQRAVELAEDAKTNGAYHDSHCWVFTPSSFLFLMEQLADTGYLHLGCSRLFDTGKNQIEFFVMLAPMASDQDVRNSWSQAREELARMHADAAQKVLEEGFAAPYVMELQALRAERASLVEQLVEMTNSKSWRVTAPLRDVRRWLGF